MALSGTAEPQPRWVTQQLARLAVADVPERPRKRDWVMAVLLIGLGLLTLLDSEIQLWDSLYTVGVGALLPWRRRYPMAGLLAVPWVVAAAVLFDQGTTTVGDLGLILLLYAMVRWAPAARGLAGLALLVVATMLSSVTAEWSLGDVSGAAVLWLFIGAVAVAMRYRANLRDQGIRQARLEERHDLARELHDVVAHHVSAIAIQAQAARAVVDGDPERAKEALGAIEATASTTLAEMRHMVGILRGSPELEPHHGLDALAELIAQPDGARVQLRVAPDAHGAGTAVEAAAFRIVQEAITNARRHGRRTSYVSVDVSRVDDDLWIQVANDGDAPLRPALEGSRDGYGLVGMQERTTALGGDFWAGPRPVGGWLVQARLPIAARPAPPALATNRDPITPHPRLAPPGPA